MKIAYCRECKVVIAAGSISPQQVIVVHGARRVLNTMPFHSVAGKVHKDVGILDVPNRDSSGNPDKLLKDLTKEFKSDFK